MPAMKTAAMPKVAGMARSYVPARTTRQERDFSYKPERRVRERLQPRYGAATKSSGQIPRRRPREALTTKNSVTAPIPRIEFVA
jgi:hypothetical protein